MASNLTDQVTELKADTPGVENTWAITSANIGGKTIVFTGGGKGVVSLEFDPDLNTMTTIREIDDGDLDAASNTVDTVKDIEAMEVVQDGSDTFLITAAAEGAITVFSVASDGDLTEVYDDTDSDGGGSSALSNLAALTQATVNGTTYVYAAGDEDSVEVYTMNTSTGALSYQSSLSVTDDDGTAGSGDDISKLGNIVSMDTIAAGGKTFMAVAAGGDKAITLFEVASDGSLTSVDIEDDAETESGSSIENDLGNVIDVEFATVGSSTFLITSEGADNGAIQVFQLDATNETLTNVFSLADGDLDAASNLVENIRRIEDLSVVENSFGTFVFAASKSDDSTTVFKLDSSGGLTLDHQFLDTASTALKDSFSGHHFTDDDGTAYYAQGGSDGFTTQQFVPCFAGDTLIAAAHGEVRACDLRAGDLVLTADCGLQPVRWIGKSGLLFAPGDDAQKPVLFPAGSLGGGRPRRALAVSPQHRMLLRDGEAEVLVPAKALIGRRGIRMMRGKRRVTYVHLMFARHQIVLAEGAAAESFLPGPFAMSAMGRAARAELFELFPQLREADAAAIYPPARELLSVQAARRRFAGGAADASVATAGRDAAVIDAGHAGGQAWSLPRTGAESPRGRWLH